MPNWNAGYNTDIDYTFGYYAELNPLRARFALTAAGLKAPEVMTACELGFGQGLSMAMHAAASPVRWHGTDFSPGQTAFARDLAQAAQVEAGLHDESFAQFCARDGLPEFDFIGLHGIWSWINDENRHIVADFVARKLKAGGVLYMGYNTQPGWANMVPVRSLMKGFVDSMQAAGASAIDKVNGSFAFLDRVLALQPAYLAEAGGMAERLEQFRKKDPKYLAHEFFGDNWHPMDFSRVAQWLQPAKLQWACSANGLESIDALNLTPELQDLLRAIPDPVFRESVRDFCVAQQFRRDYWVKGARRLHPLERLDLLRSFRVMLAQAVPAVKLKVRGSLGDARLQPHLYSPLLNALADHRPCSLDELARRLRNEAISFDAMTQMVTILLATGALQLVQPECAEGVRQQALSLNTHLLASARSSGDVAYLGSTVTGGGVPVSRFQQLFLLARSQGHAGPQDWARFVWQIVQAQGQTLFKEGRPLETEAEGIAELTLQATEFASQQLPVLQALQVA